VANKTNNYKFPKPEADDFYDIAEYNKAMDILDDSLTEMDQKKLDKNGDASEAVTEFEQEILRENIESGETLSSTFGKIKKWFTEMKDVAFSGHAKDVTTDAAHRFVSDTEKSSWNGKVGATGGDISETSIGILEPISIKYPVPIIGDSTKVFMGKIKKYIEDTKPLDAEMTVYVATTGHDTDGEGTSAKPYKTIQHAIDVVPKDLGGYTAIILIADGIYPENVIVNGFHSGSIYIRPKDRIKVISDNCIVSSFRISQSTAFIHINSLRIIESQEHSGGLYEPIRIDGQVLVRLDHLKIVENHKKNLTAVFLTGRSAVDVIDCEISNHLRAIHVDDSNAYISNCTGTNNSYAILSTSGGRITQDGIKIVGDVNSIAQTGGEIISQYGAVIGTLQANVSLYVTTTGSDVTGDGTQSKPYRTISYAVNTLPKDLGGFTVNISVYDGNYDEIVYVQGFQNGIFSIARYGNWTTLNTTCNVTGFVCEHCTARFTLAGLNLTCTDEPGVKASECTDIIIWYCQSLTTSDSGFYFEACVGRIDSCKITNKKWGMIAAYMSRMMSTAWASGSFGTDNGIAATNGSTVHLVGSQPAGAWQYGTNSGGQFILENGTQISGLMAPGLSCNWGTISGGYVRHGNLNGSAMITIQLRVGVTTNLTAGQTYYVRGFPTTAFSAIPVSVHRQDAIQSCYIAGDTICIAFARNILANDSFYFNVTYLTNP
jgi:hypothetical protein